MLYKFSQHSKINESFSDAKALLLKLGIEKKKNKLGVPPEEKVELSDKEKEKILKNPDILELFDLFQSNPNLVYPFTYFVAVEGLPVSHPNPEVKSVEKIFNLYKKVKPLLHIFPLRFGDIMGYIKNKKEEDRTPAYEHLDDDLEVILSTKKPAKEFVERFNRPGADPIRKEFKKSLELERTDPERAKLLDRLYTAVNTIKNLKPVVSEVSGKLQTYKDAEDQLAGAAGKYTDYTPPAGNPEFRDTLKAFEAFIKDVEEKPKMWGLGDDTFIDQLEDIRPSIKVLQYDKDSRLVVTSGRSYEGMKAVCGISNAPHCIQRDSETFLSYTAGRLQISFNNLSLDKTDNKAFFTLTINADGSIHDSKYRDNKTDVGRRGENYEKVLKKIGFGDYTEAIRKNFSSELGIKNLLDKITERSKQDETEKGKNQTIIYTLGSISLQKGIEDGTYDPKELKAHKDLVINILKKEMNIKYEEVVECFLDKMYGGFFSKEDVDLFSLLTEGRHSKKDVENIWEITKICIKEYKEVIIPAIQHSKDAKNISLTKKFQYVVDSHPFVENYLMTVFN